MRIPIKLQEGTFERETVGFSIPKAGQQSHRVPVLSLALPTLSPYRKH